MAVTDNKNPDLGLFLSGGDFELAITVGIHEEEGSQAHGDDGLTTGEIGSVHEFGLGVPMRSFVRGYFDENMGYIEHAQDEAMQRILDGADPMLEAERLAKELEIGMRDRVLERIAPPLASSTRARRGQTAIPLVDSTQLLGAIRGRVAVRR
jgi:hypothetical protein